MFKSMVNDKHEIFWLIFHVAFGIACGLSKFALIGWFYLILIVAFFLLLRDQNKDFITVRILSYALALEQINRSINATPFVPYELGRYSTTLFIILSLLLLRNTNNSSRAGVIFLLFGVTGFFAMDNYKYADIVTNYLGVLNLGLGMIYFSRLEMTYSDFKGIMKMFMFSIFSFAVLITFKQQQLDKVVYGLRANYETSGGSATNQVSTILGFGVVLLGLAYLTNQRIFKTKFVDEAMLFFILFRAFLTFSRGGVVTAIIALLLVIAIPKTRNIWANRQVVFRKIDPSSYIIGFIFLVFTFLVVNVVTGNFLLLRYQGYTEGSAKKADKYDLNSISSNRLVIAESDLVMFADNPVFGVGFGQSRWLRPNYGYNFEAMAHVEVTRMMSEQGLFGLLMAIIFLFYPFYRIPKDPSNYNKAIMTALFTVAILSTFHAAMRTMITPLLYGFACMRFLPDPKYRYNARSRTDAEVGAFEKKEVMALA